MKRLGLAGLMIGLLLTTAAQAADLSVYVSCVTQADDQFIVWFGYSASDDLTGGGFGYVGGGPGIEVDDVKAGDYPLAAMDYFSPDGEPVMFFADGFFEGDYLYAEAWFDPANYEAAPCDEELPLSAEPVTLDDSGTVNNPYVNERANTCYGPGQACVSEADWEAGWYLIRKQYGLLH